jgi:hypothetical protein
MGSERIRLISGWSQSVNATGFTHSPEGVVSRRYKLLTPDDVFRLRRATCRSAVLGDKDPCLAIARTRCPAEPRRGHWGRENLPHLVRGELRAIARRTGRAPSVSAARRAARRLRATAAPRRGRGAPPDRVASSQPPPPGGPSARDCPAACGGRGDPRPPSCPGRVDPLRPARPSSGPRAPARRGVGPRGRRAGRARATLVVRSSPSAPGATPQCQDWERRFLVDPGRNPGS